MSAGDSNEDKSFDPTEARIAKARRDGDVAQSREANAAAAYLGFYVAFLASGAILATVLRPLSALLREPVAYSTVLLRVPEPSAALMIAVGGGAIAFLLMPALGAMLSLVAQRALAFAPSKLAPKLSRLAIVANAKQKFGPDGIAEFVKGALKLALIMAAFGILLARGLERWPSYAGAPSIAAPEMMQREVAVFLGLICLFSVLVAAIDLPWQFARHRKKLMMSVEDLKRESKESEGDPAMKQSRRQRAKALATNRMLLDVPTANVVIVNPTHFAVALKWAGPKSGAPTLVAKGADEMAAKIREIAERSGVPIRSDPPTARAIYSVVEVGREIRRSHYAAVAAAIIFAEKARRAARPQ